MANSVILMARMAGLLKSETEDQSELFGMPFANREAAVIIASELNAHDRGLWFYKVERHGDRRWITVRESRKLDRIVLSNPKPSRLPTSGLEQNPSRGERGS